LQRIVVGGLEPGLPQGALDLRRVVLE